MKNFLKLFAFLLTIHSGQALACPTCIGSGPNDHYYLWVIGVFILLIYFPMFYLFKTFFKYKDINKIQIEK